MDQPELFFRMQVRARVTVAPTFQHVEEGAICHFVVAGEAGVASTPPKLSVFVSGEEEAKRCARLREGDVVELAGEMGVRLKCERGVEYLAAALKVQERVILRFRPGGAEVAA